MGAKKGHFTSHEIKENARLITARALGHVIKLKLRDLAYCLPLNPPVTISVTQPIGTHVCSWVIGLSADVISECLLLSSDPQTYPFFLADISDTGAPAGDPDAGRDARAAERGARPLHAVRLQRELELGDAPPQHRPAPRRVREGAVYI